MRFFVILASLFLSLTAQAEIFNTTSFQVSLSRQSIYQARQELVARTGQVLVRYNYPGGVCYVLARRGDLPCRVSVGAGMEFMLSISSEALFEVLIGDLQWFDNKYFGEFQAAWPKKKDLVAVFGSFASPTPAALRLVSSLDIRTADSKIIYVME